MRLVNGIENAPKVEQGRAVAIGFFDGVHWGHRAIFEELLRVAVQERLVSTALTFNRHPAELLAANRAPSFINTMEQRIERISLMGIDEIVVAVFDLALANLPKDEFVSKILIESLGAKRVVVGSNFRFGKDREGDVRYLSLELERLGLGLSVVSAVVINGAAVSSTRIRTLIARGDVEDAGKLLGHKFVLRGQVVTGEQIGRKIGFPTANIQAGPRQIVPARGVYVVESVIGKTTYGGVCNIGSRPTFDGRHETIEIHFSGFNGDLYGEVLDITFCRRLRDEMIFESPEKLIEQIRKDLERAAGGCAS